MESASVGLMSIVAWGGYLVQLLMQLALLVIGLTIVRPRHAGAAWLFVAGAGTSILGTCLSGANSFFVGFLGSDLGVDDLTQIMAISTMLSVVVHALSFGLVLAGIVKLAQVPVDAGAETTGGAG